MRRDIRERRNSKQNFNTSIYITGGVLMLAIATFIITSAVYNNNLEKYSTSGLTSEQMASLVPNLENETEEASQTVTEAASEKIEPDSETGLVINLEFVDDDYQSKEENGKGTLVAVICCGLAVAAITVIITAKKEGKDQ